MKLALCRLGLLMLVTMLGGAGARGTTLERISLDGLTLRAEAIVQVECLASESRWEGGEIWTFTHFEVRDTWKGIVPRLLTVRLPGGKVGHLISSIEAVPRFHPGEEAILFLKRTRDGALTVLSWAQGTFRVRREPDTGRSTVTQDSAELPVFDGATMRFRTEGIRGLPLAAFKKRIAKLIQDPSRMEQP